MYNICRCPCHENVSMRHIIACCDGPCHICGINITRGGMDEHIEEHSTDIDRTGAYQIPFKEIPKHNIYMCINYFNLE
jgi:hypothetical protein